MTTVTVRQNLRVIGADQRCAQNDVATRPSANEDAVLDERISTSFERPADEDERNAIAAAIAIFESRSESTEQLVDIGMKVGIAPDESGAEERERANRLRE